MRTLQTSLKTALKSVGLIVLVPLLVAQSTREQSARAPSEFDGFTAAYRVVNLGAPVDGILETVNVDRGDRVRAGQVLATLESTVEQATVDLTQERAKLVGELKGQEARLRYSRNEYAKQKQLFDQGVLSEDKLERSLAERLIAEAGVEQAQENLRIADLERKRAEAVLALRSIESPIDGVVVERLLSPGELVTRHNQSRILKLAQIHPLRVEVMLPGRLFGSIRAGMQATVAPDNFEDQPVVAEVKTVDPIIEAASGTFRVRLEMSNEDNSLPAGLKCRVRFETE